ncbi:MAG: rRNA maturation RNase YbeY [Bacteroidetes bacterium]|nr:rRNA maturation RNase YbeY [Bacteroidota bacterium]
MSKQIHFFNKGSKFLVKNKGKLVRWLEEVIRYEGRIVGEINYILTDDKTLLKYNIKYLNTDTLTDIITFSMSEEEEIVSGDVYVSVERVIENAKKYKVTLEDELRRIFIHGILHLMGYNDTSVGERRKMTRLENKFLSIYLEK